VRSRTALLSLLGGSYGLPGMGYGNIGSVYRSHSRCGRDHLLVEQSDRPDRLVNKTLGHDARPCEACSAPWQLVAVVDFAQGLVKSARYRIASIQGTAFVITSPPVTMGITNYSFG
jgi:hypothetical protein